MKIESKKAVVTRVIISFFTSAYAAFLNVQMREGFLKDHFFTDWLKLMPKFYLFLLPYVLIMGPITEILVNKNFSKKQQIKIEK